MPRVSVVAYYADDPTRVYQLVQWLPVLEVLHELHPVGIVLRDPDSAEIVRSRTSVPVHLAPSFPQLTELYAELAAKVVLYCNNSPLNFQSLIDARVLHVHVNHGESDKQSMSSNNAKAYDRVFVAGEAAVQRHASTLMEFDTRRLVRVGRPQLDVGSAPLLAPSARRTVLYAPTWEGDADYNNYTSLDTLGLEIVRSVLALRDVRLVYKPHPKISTGPDVGVREAHRAVLGLLAEAADREPEAGHVAITQGGDILRIMPDCDAMITDVSAVGLDWLYLCTNRPIFLTDRHRDNGRLREEVPVSRCADIVDQDSVPDLTRLLADRLAYDDLHLARIAMRHHYFDGLQVGESTHRFLEAVSEVVALRDRLQGVGGATASDAVTA